MEDMARVLSREDGVASPVRLKLAISASPVNLRARCKLKPAQPCAAILINPHPDDLYPISFSVWAIDRQ